MCFFGNSPLDKHDSGTVRMKHSLLFPAGEEDRPFHVA
jgi:hypothetical protein